MACIPKHTRASDTDCAPRQGSRTKRGVKSLAFGESMGSGFVCAILCIKTSLHSHFNSLTIIS